MSPSASHRRARADVSRVKPDVMSSNDFAQDFCHLDRDLDVGAIGGDVFCIQRLLERKKFSNEQPNGTFTEATRRGVAKWARANKWHHVTGSVDASLRRAYGEVSER